MSYTKNYNHAYNLAQYLKENLPDMIIYASSWNETAYTVTIKPNTKTRNTTPSIVEQIKYLVDKGRLLPETYITQDLTGEIIVKCGV